MYLGDGGVCLLGERPLGSVAGQLPRGAAAADREGLPGEAKI